MTRLFQTRRQSSNASVFSRKLTTKLSDPVPDDEPVPLGGLWKTRIAPPTAQPRSTFHKSQGDDLLNKLEAKLPCNSGIALSAVEADQMNEHIASGLAQLAASSPDYIVWSLCRMAEKLFLRVLPDNTFADDVLDSHLYLLKVLTRVLNARWPTWARPLSDTTSSHPSGGPFPPSPSATSFAAASARTRPARYPASKPSDASLRSDSTALSWAEPFPLDDATARYALDVAAHFLRDTFNGAPGGGARAAREACTLRGAEGSMYAWDAADWEPALAAPPRARRTAAADPADLAWEQTALPEQGASGRGAFLHGGGSHYTMYAHEYTRDRALHGSYFASVAVLVSKYAGRVVYNLAASNWAVVFRRVQERVRRMAEDRDYAASAPAPAPPPKGKPLSPTPTPAPAPAIDDVVELRLLTVCLLDRHRLAAVLHEFVAHFSALSPAAQDVAALAVRAAVTNWVDNFPRELAELWNAEGSAQDVVRRRRVLDGYPERLFDALHAASAAHPKRAAWLHPALAALLSIVPERLEAAADAADGSARLTKKNNFLTQLASGAARPAAVAHLELVRAAWALPEARRGTALRDAGALLALELKRFLLHPPLPAQPFYTSPQPLDVNFTALCIAAVFRFHPRDTLAEVILVCLEPQRSAAVKLAVLKALVLLVVEAPKYAWQPSLEFLYAGVAPRMRGICMALLGSNAEILGGIARPAAPLPTCQSLALAGAESAIDESIRLLLQIETLFTLDPPFWLHGITDEELAVTQDDAKSMIGPGGDKRPKATTVMGFCAMQHRALNAHPDTPWYPAAMRYLQFTVPSAFAGLSLWLLNAAGDDHEFHRMACACLHTALQHLAEGSPYDQDNTWRFSPFTTGTLPLVELALWTALSSSQLDISASAQRSLRLLSAFERLPEAPPPPAALSPADFAARCTVLEGLGDPRAVIVGRVAALRRICKHAALLAAPTPALLLAFRQFAYRWAALIPRVEAGRATRDEGREWQNKMCIMAGAAGALLDAPDMPLEPGQMAILPPQLRGPAPPRALVEAFLARMVGLLAAEVVDVRRRVREALAHELHMRLVPVVIDLMTRETQRRFALGDVLGPTTVTFVETMLGVVNALFERIDGRGMVLETPAAEQSVLLAKYIARLPLSTRSLTMRTQFCRTADVLLSKRHLIAIRDENAFRNSIADIVAAWIEKPPHLVSSEGEGADYPRVAMEAHIAAMRTFVRVLDTMHIDAGEPAAAELAQPSRLFRRYLMAFVQTLVPIKFNDFSESSVSLDRSSLKSDATHDNEALVNELVVSGIAHLLNNNLEAGIRHCLEFCYGDDYGLRVLLMKAFTRVLNFGTKFNPERITAPKEPELGLCKMLTECEMILSAVIEACPSGDVDHLIPVLLRVFNTRKSVVSLLKLMVDKEVALASTAVELLRGHGIGVRLLSYFTRQHGYRYLRSILDNLIKQMKDVPPDCSFELDPMKVPPGESQEANTQTLIIITQAFINVIFESWQTLPMVLREVCHHLGKVVHAVWPESKYAALGALLFLRFLSPAIVTPEIVDIDIERDPRAPVIRRGLILVANILQHLANNSRFGKESYLTVLNPFMDANVHIVNKYLSFSQTFEPPTAEEEQCKIGAGCDDTDSLVLHRFLQSHTDPIGKYLLRLPSPFTGRSKFANGKDAWDALCAQLVEMGTAHASPPLSLSTSSGHTAYNEFMSRNEDRNTDGMLDIFAPHQSLRGVAFVFSFAKVHIETLDFELLLYFVFKSVASIVENGLGFDVVFDFTAFTSLSELPVPWLKRALELLPSDFRRQWQSTFILNVNGLSQVFLRQIIYIFSDVSLGQKTQFVSSVKDLQLLLGDNFMLASSAATLELQTVATFEDVDQQFENYSWTPVRLFVGDEHLRIISVKAHQVSHDLCTHTVEVIHLREVEDIYRSVEENQLIVRRLLRTPSITFSSPSCDKILKALHAARQRATVANPPLFPTSEIPDLSAALLAIGLLHASHQVEYIRGAAFELLTANCAYMRYPPDAQIPWRGSFIPTNSLAFVINFSRRIAAFSPQMTSDFMHEWSRGFDSAKRVQQITCIQYISPWLKNLNSFSDPNSPLFEHTGSTVRNCIQIFVKITMQDLDSYPILQRAIWLPMGNLASNVIDIVVDELIQVAVDSGIGSRRCETASDTLIALSSIRARSRVLSELRILVTSACSRPVRSMMEAKEWVAIAALSRVVLVAGHSPSLATQNQLYAPEMAHLVSMLAATGPLTMRSTIYGIAVNLMQGLYVARASDAAAPAQLRELLDSMGTPKYLKLFGLDRRYPSSEISILEPVSPHISIESLEKITATLLRALELGAESTGLSNVWCSRWMSLVTSLAFQSSFHLQSRAFTILGYLAELPMDKDVYHQMLVAFQKNILYSNQEEDMSAAWSMLRCMRKAVSGLPSHSESLYLLTNLFWLAVSLIQCGNTHCYTEALGLLRETVETLDRHGVFDVPNSDIQNPMESVLMNSRRRLSDAALRLDMVSGLSFETSFGFALVMVLWRGSRNSADVELLRTVLSALSRVAVKAANPAREKRFQLDSLTTPLFIGLAPCVGRDEYARLLAEDFHITNPFQDMPGNEGKVEPNVCLSVLDLRDATKLLLATSLTLSLDSSNHIPARQKENLHLYWAEFATSHADLFSSGMFHFISSAESGWMSKKMDTLFNMSSSTAHLQDIASCYEIVMSHATPDGSPMTSSSTLEMGNGVLMTGNSFSQRLTDIKMIGAVEPFLAVDSRRTRAIQCIPALLDPMVTNDH